MTKSTTRETADIAGVVGKNAIINGNFDIWQRALSQTVTGYGSDDRWINSVSGSTQVVSRQAFTLGQTDVPNNPTYYSRTVVTSVAGAGNLAIKFQKIEGVETFAGTTATVSFWAKADASKNIAIEFTQSFGTGGTNPAPSANVLGIGVTTVALTTSWVKHTVSVAVPSISGKTIGTDGNDFLTLIFWLDAGSNYNSRTNSLGQQSGTFDFSQVQMEAGSVATEFEPRSVGQELDLCERYLYTLLPNLSPINSNIANGVNGATTTALFVVRHPSMRGQPTLNVGFVSRLAILTLGGAPINLTGLVLDRQAGVNALRLIATIASASLGRGYAATLVSSVSTTNTLFLDAEL